MLSRIIVGLAVTIFCAAIGRGIVFALGLDVKVARMINAAATSTNLQAIAWTISGALGLIGLIGWQLFHISERIESIAPFNRPALGSLAYVILVVNGEKDPTGRLNVRISAELENTNDFLLKYRARVTGEVNGKKPSKSEITFDGYIPAHQRRYLVYEPIYDVPTQLSDPAMPFLRGWLHYDVTYFAAPLGRSTRRTARRISFNTFLGADQKPIGTRIEERATMILSEEEEE